jgi:hypothetical protein
VYLVQSMCEMGSLITVSLAVSLSGVGDFVISQPMQKPYLLPSCPSMQDKCKSRQVCSTVGLFGTPICYRLSGTVPSVASWCVASPPPWPVRPPGQCTPLASPPPWPVRPLASPPPQGWGRVRTMLAGLNVLGGGVIAKAASTAGGRGVQGLVWKGATSAH